MKKSFAAAVLAAGLTLAGCTTTDRKPDIASAKAEPVDLTYEGIGTGFEPVQLTIVDNVKDVRIGMAVFHVAIFQDNATGNPLPMDCKELFTYEMMLLQSPSVSSAHTVAELEKGRKALHCPVMAV